MISARGAVVAGATLFLGMVLLISGGCGYKTPPVPPATVVPQPIEDLRFTVVDDAVRLTWTYPRKTINGAEIQEISSFNLYHAEISMDDYCSTCPVPFVEPIEVAGGQTVVDRKPRVASYDFTMPQPGNKYFFKVQSRTGWWATSADSNIVTFVWHIPAAAPAGLSAAAADSAVELSWQPVTSRRDGEPVTTEVWYQVLRRSGEAGFAKIGDLVQQTNYIDKNVTNGQQYAYQVQSVLRFGDDLVYGESSTDVLVTPVDITPPPAPEGVMAIETSQGIRIIWDGSEAEDVAGYNIYRRTDQDSSLLLVGSVASPSTTYIDGSAGQDERYYYSVTALDKTSPANESARSQEATPR